MEITLAPTLASQTGFYTLTTTVCMTDYPLICYTSSEFTVTVICVIETIEIVQQSDNSALITQSYLIPSADAFTYQLALIQTPACDYKTTAWVTSTTS